MQRPLNKKRKINSFPQKHEDTRGFGLFGFFTAMIVSTWFNKQNRAFSQLAPSATAEFFQRDSSRYQPQRVFAQESKFLQSHLRLKIYPNNLET